MDPNIACAPRRPPASRQFVSELSNGRQRFLAYAVDHALATRRRSADDFLRHFSPSVIMRSLGDEPALRARILVAATGANEAIGRKKSVATAAEDLRLALEEGAVDAETIVTLLEPDERARYLDARKLWRFLVEDRFWMTSPSQQAAFERAKQQLAFLLNRAIEHALLTERDVIDGITIDELVTRLPKSELGRIIGCALGRGRNDAPFNDRDLLRACATRTLLRYVPPPDVWSRVVEPCIAQAHGYVVATPRTSSSEFYRAAQI